MGTLPCRLGGKTLGQLRESATHGINDNAQGRALDAYRKHRVQFVCGLDGLLPIPYTRDYGKYPEVVRISL